MTTRMTGRCTREPNPTLVPNKPIRCAKWNSRLDGIDLLGSGVNLCFGRHSGYGGYSNAVRGSRQIVVNEDTLQDFEVETWNRLEDASISGLVTLNSTYGTDKYPVVPYKDSSDEWPL